MIRKCLYRFSFLVATLILISVFFMGSNSNYYLFIYNSDSVSDEDREYIVKYSHTMNGQVKFIDSKNVKNASSLAVALKNAYKNIENNILGIQLFGTVKEVPAFDIGYEIDMRNGKMDTVYDDFVSDFFYSNFYNDTHKLVNKTKIHDFFKYKMDLSFQPKWQVARLPLQKGEIAPFIKKYFDYQEKTKEMKIPIVSFSNPIIWDPFVACDDMGYFIKNKIDREQHYLTESDYRLYGLTEGYNKVLGRVQGDFISENVEKENQNGIMHLFINCHGEKDKFIKAVCVRNSEWNPKVSSFMDRSNVNKILKDNYYTLTTWCCLTAQGLDNENIIYGMLRHKCIDAIAATAIISNNGTRNDVSWEGSRKNNLYNFYYEFFRSLSLNNKRSVSFFNGQKEYAKSVMNNEHLDSFEYHILNLLSYHYLGLI